MLTLPKYIQPAAASAVNRDLQLKARERVSVEDFGGGVTKTATQNAAAIMAAQVYLKTLTAAGGGVIHMGHGKYPLLCDEVSIQENITLRGSSNNIGYDDTYWGGGTEIEVEGNGAFGIILEVRQAALENMYISRKAADTTVYGLVESGAMHRVENVAIRRFDYNHVVGGGMNSNVHRNCLWLGAEKVNFAILPQKVGDVVGRCYPDIEDRIPTTGNTVASFYDCRAREGYVNWAFLDGFGVDFYGVCMSESSQKHGIVGFKRTNCDRFNFHGFYQENDHHEAAAVGDYDNIELFDTTGGILVGDVSGAWNSVNDGGTGWWLGSAVESYSNGGIYNFSNGGGPSYWWWSPACTLITHKQLFRIRSARFPVFDRPFIGSQTVSSAAFKNTTANCYGMEINDVSAYVLTDDIKNMTVGGTRTTYRNSEPRLQGSVGGVVSAVATTLKDISTMSPGNEYEYSVGIASVPQLQYSARGTFVVGVGGSTGFPLAAAFNGSNLSVTMTAAGLLQVTQTSGAPQEVFYKIKCRGRAEFV